MPANKLYPGQVKRATFDLPQVKALASAIRTEVFWSFNPEEALSVAEVATALGKSAQTVHYHVHELVEVGLLMAVETRRRRARTESLYVHSALDFYGQGPSASTEYRQFIRKGFAAITRAMIREEEAIQKVYDLPDTSIAAFSAYNRVSIRLSAERAADLKRRLNAVLEEVASEGEDEDGLRLNVALFMKPTQAESRHWLERARAAKRKSGKVSSG